MTLRDMAATKRVGGVVEAVAAESGERRVLVTMHLPIEMGCFAGILRAISKAYPDAVVGDNGTVWNRRAEATAAAAAEDGR